MSLRSPARWAHRHARTAVLVAAVLLLALLLRPPADSVASARLDHVPMAVVVILLVLVPAALLRRRFTSQRYWTRWGAVSVAALLALAASLSAYVERRAAYSATFEDGLIVVGDDRSLTDVGKLHRQDHPRATPADLLRRTAGRPELVWDPATLRDRGRTLHGLYLLSVALAALAAAGLAGAWRSGADIVSSAPAPVPVPAAPLAGPARRFTVALSFPGEVRQRADAIARALEPALGRDRIFYDRWYAAELARPNMDLHLHEIYRKESDLLVVLLCAEYQQKEWCGLEWRAVRDLVKARESARMMFLRLDDAPIEGLLSIDGYLDIAEMDDDAVAEAILSRASTSARR